MPTTAFYRNMIVRGVGAIQNSLHFDLALAVLALIGLVAGIAAGNPDFQRGVGRLLPNAVKEAPANLRQNDPPQTVARLAPAMAAALDQSAARYRVSPEALRPIFEAAQAAARERSLDPLLIIAVISIESRFNPISQSPMGAQGLMQIIPRYHLDKVMDGREDQPFLDPVRNVQIGAQILQEAIRRQGGVIEGLQFYAGANNDPEQAYASKVLAEKQRLEQAPRRREAPPS